MTNLSLFAKSAGKVQRVVACWGAGHHALKGRAEIVKKMLDGKRRLEAFGFTRDGHPLHPLYLKKTCETVPI